jgi:hypothetical protein
MNGSRLIRSAVLGLAVAAAAVPSAFAQQDLRSPDTRDAALAAESQAAPRQDLRSPDARDAAEGRGTFSAPEVTFVKVSEPAPASDGMDWGDAGIGAGGLLGLLLLGLGGTLAIVHRREGSVGQGETA